MFFISGKLPFDSAYLYMVLLSDAVIIIRHFLDRKAASDFVTVKYFPQCVCVCVLVCPVGNYANKVKLSGFWEFFGA